MNKAVLRRELLAKRKSAEKTFIRESSEKICRKFEEMFGDFKVYLLYLPIKCEVDTSLLAEKLYKEGKSVYLPCVAGEDLIFKRFEGLHSLCEGAFGVSESVGDVLKEVAEVVVVPAVAYDERCNRLGYGKGFYDRFLALHGNALKVGFAFDFQIVKSVCPNRLDKPVDFIITETRVFERPQIMDTE